MGEVSLLLEDIREEYNVPPDKLIDLNESIRKSMKNLGILTEEVKKNLEKMSKGVIEIGQQPLTLGGPSLILNKIAYAFSLSSLDNSSYTPLFYVADYDGVHSELTNGRIPSPSQTGLLISYPDTEKYKGVPIYELPNPPEDWLWENIEKIASNYRGLIRDIESREREKIELNLEHCFTIVKNAYFSTENVRDFSTKILGTLVNIEANLGVPFLISCDPEIRRQFKEGYEVLLSEPNRTNFIDASNEAVKEIRKNGYEPQIGHRGPEYVPFFLECMTYGCHRQRIELKYKAIGNKTKLYGRCERCGEKYEYILDRENPDLSEVINWISPRVDSRQVIVDSVLPVLAHIGGPGETGYYAEVIPGVKPLEIPFPVYLRYSRTWYNTPWNEVIARELEEYDLPILLSEDLFNAVGLWVEARNDEDKDKLKEGHKAIENSVIRTYNSLLEEKIVLENQINKIKSKLSEPEGREKRIKQLQEIQHIHNLVEKYLSSTFGRFMPEHFGQEVSWIWVDVAAVSGINDLLGIYLRVYNKHTPNSSMFFVNL